MLFRSDAGISSARCEISGMRKKVLNGAADYSSSIVGRNLTALRGGIFTAAPVRGLRPTRAAFCCTLNVPRPVRVRRSPSRSDYTVTRIMASTALRASIFEMFASRAIASTNCALFILFACEKLRLFLTYWQRYAIFLKVKNYSAELELCRPPSGINGIKIWQNGKSVLLLSPERWREFDWLMSGLDIEQPKAIKST